jgi:hypothetical protein
MRSPLKRSSNHKLSQISPSLNNNLTLSLHPNSNLDSNNLRHHNRDKLNLLKHLSSHSANNKPKVLVVLVRYLQV